MSFYSLSLSTILLLLPSMSPGGAAAGTPAAGTTMSNNTSPPSSKRGVESLKKFGRRMKPFEQIGVLGFFLFTSLVFLLVLLCFFYSDYRPEFAAVVAGGGGLPEKGAGECDLFEGEWVWDERYPLYNSTECAFMDLGFRCSENGRGDDYYAKWRWRPSRCELSRFDAKKMLEKLRNRRLVFVGDSIGRNQWESLLCMLSSVVDKNSIYELNGNPISKHTGYLMFKFKDYNCTVEYFRSPFLVVQGHPPRGAPKKVKTTLRVDTVEWSSNRWRGADVLIFNSGHWWNYEKTIRGGCYFQIGDEVKMDMTVDIAYKRSMKTLIDWIDKHVNTTSTQVIFRTYSPVHFSGGDWKTGGSCHRETVPVVGNSHVSLKPWSQFLEPFRNMPLRPKIDILNITKMTARRKDGHLSLYYLGPSLRAPLYRQDCSHWCLPGVPDAWNELLYALFMRHQSSEMRPI